MAEPQPASEQPASEQPAAPTQPRLDRLGTTLRRAYDNVATERLPTVFEDLLSQLR